MICEEVVRISAKNPKTPDFMQALRMRFPSCAPWFAKACLSDHRLDQKAVLSNILLGKLPSESLRCKTPSADPIGNSRENLDSLMNCLNGAIDRDPPKPHQAGLAHRALEGWNLINRKREQDLTTILSFFEKEKLRHSVSNLELGASIKTLSGRVKAAATRAGARENEDWQRFVADQISDAAKDTHTKWKDVQGVDHRDTEPGFFSRLRQEKSDAARFKELVTRAKQIDSGSDDDFDGNLTPYHSKMILLYHLENSIRTKYVTTPAKADAVLNELAARLHLKADFTPGGRTQWGWVIPHDGFVLGASPPQMKHLLSGDTDPAEQRNNGTGIDCATFVQHMLLASGYKTVKSLGRLTSAGIASGGQLKTITRLEPLKDSIIPTLGPGDIIVKREKGDPIGHVQMVVGYEGNPPDLVVVSAEGGYQRGVIKRRIPVFPNQPNDCEYDSYFTTNKDYLFFRASLMKGPQ